MPARVSDQSRLVRGRLSARVAITVALITMLAFWARATGLSFQLPHTPSVDEIAMFVQLEHVRGEPARPGKASLPYAYPRLLTTVANAVLPRASASTPRTLDEHLERARHDVLAMRWMSALLGTLALPLTFWLARRFTSDGGALIATALLGASLLHALYSSQARPHAALTTFTLLAAHGALAVKERGSLLAYAAAGAACALACATLHSGVFTLSALVVAHLLRPRPASPRALAKVFVAFAIVALTLVWAFPPEPPRPLDAAGERGASDPIRGHGTTWSDFRGAGFIAIARALANYEPWIALLTIAAVVTWFFASRRGGDLSKTRARWNPDVLVLLAHIVSHVVAFGMFERTFQRFMLPIVPYFCCASGWLAIVVARRLAKRTGASPSAWTWALGLVLVAPPAFVCARFAALKRAPDTQELAARWIDSHLDRTSTRLAIVPTFDVPLVRDAAGQRTSLLEDPFAFALWTFHQVVRAESELKPLAWRIDDVALGTAAQRQEFERDPAAFVRGLGATHVVVEVIQGRRRVLIRELREAARAQGRLVARFAPRDGVEGDTALLYQLDGPNAPESGFAWRVARFDRLGPDIEIYALSSDDRR